MLYNIPRSKADRLQRLLNQCPRILTKSPRREHITPLLKINTLAQNSGYNYIQNFEINDLRPKLLVACLVIPALWLNLSDSRNILIIHFGQLIKERTLASIGHDL